MHGPDEPVRVAEEAQREVGGLQPLGGPGARVEGRVHDEGGGEGEVLGWGHEGRERRRGRSGRAGYEEVEEQGQCLDVWVFWGIVVSLCWAMCFRATVGTGRVGFTEFFFEVDDAVFAQFVWDGFARPVKGSWESVVARLREPRVGCL